ncbi:MAG: hypothetical protein PHS76_07110 [Sphaerochaeta sp.]|jgi:hypothetical protein|nr:hypothetical protein [Sphaerochaeta sp.]
MAKTKSSQHREIWDRLPGENAAQYDKFCRYRDMRYTGADGRKLDGIQAPFRRRNLRGLAEEMGIKRHMTLGDASVKYNWVERCEAYDIEIERQNREQQEQAILKMNKDHADLAAQMVRKAAKRLLTIPEEELSAADIVRLVDVGVKIERLSRGESTENKQISGETTMNHTGAVTVKATSDLNLSDLTDEELAQLEGLLDKLHPEPVL